MDNKNSVEEVITTDNTKEQLKKIDKMIDANLEEALKLLNDILSRPTQYSKYNEGIKYLQNKINEVVLYQKLNEEQQSVYNMAIKDGHNLNLDKDYRTAYNYYMYAKETTNHPIFDYYIGKILYKLGNHDLSYEYLSNYELNGGVKTVKVIMYLNMIDYRRNNIEKIKERQKITNKIITTFDIDFVDSYVDIIINKNDNVKNQELKSDDISSQEELYFKLEQIKEMYRNGKIKTADKLLSKLSRNVEGKDNKEKIKEVIKSKKLYINQRKY